MTNNSEKLHWCESLKSVLDAAKADRDTALNNCMKDLDSAERYHHIKCQMDSELMAMVEEKWRIVKWPSPIGSI